jgi:hypothetical protein
MGVATPAGVDKVERVILNVLRKHDSGMTASDLVSAVLASALGINDVDVKRGIWRLIAAHQLEFSPDQLLVHASNRPASNLNRR